jgi:sulfatase modifying factor 1
VRRLLVAVAAVVSCGPSELPRAGQVLVHVTTDAPLPPPPGVAARADAPRPLFDRLDVAVFAPGESTPCDGCERSFAVDADQVEGDRLTFGIVPQAGRSGYRARIRLYRGLATAATGPREASTVETVVALPPIGAEGVTELAVVLRTDDVARPQGTLADPIPATSGRPPAGLVGSWPGARRIPCAIPTPEGMACIAGQAFWMGNPRPRDLEDWNVGGGLERIVVVAPYFIDAQEVTVAQMRAGGAAGPFDPRAAGTSSCTYTAEVGRWENYAVSCVTQPTAMGHCSKRGARLPTEAEFELAASGENGSSFVWGEDVPACEDAVFARKVERGLNALRSCDYIDIGPAPIRTGPRDVLSTNDGPVHDLAAGVAEWALDVWSADRGGCWGTGVFVDPLCTADRSESPDARTFRGGAFDAQAGQLRAAVRWRIDDGTRYLVPNVGFRCAQSGR